jgi:putative phage-type endonuclease
MSSPVAGLSPAQVEIRKSGLGASEIAAIAGLDPYRNALDVFLTKTGQAPPFEGNEFTRWGNRLEAVIADEYAERLGVTVSAPGATLRHATETWMLATPDRLVLTDDPNVSWGLECKSRGHRQAERWGEHGTDEVPHDVAAQCHWSMAVTGLARWDVAVLIGGNDFRVYTLERDEAIAAGLIDIGRRFWFDHVVAGVHPPLDGSDTAHAFIAKKYPLHSDELVDAPADIVEQVKILTVHKQAIERHETAKSAIEVTLKDFIGTRLGAILPFGKVTWKQIASGGVDYKAVATALNASKELIAEHTRPGYRRLLAQVRVEDIPVEGA